MRGGSWNNNHRNARVRERNRNNPDNSNNNVGLRVVASHGLWVRPEMSRGDRCGAEARADDSVCPKSGTACPWPAAACQRRRANIE